MENNECNAAGSGPLDDILVSLPRPHQEEAVEQPMQSAVLQKAVEPDEPAESTATQEVDASAELQKAIDAHNVAALTAALPKAVAAGVSTELIERARATKVDLEAEVWSLRVRRHASQALQEALRQEVPERLAAAMDRAREAGLNEELLEIAREQLERQRGRQDIEQALLAKLQAGLRGAADVEVLSNAIKHADQVGVCSELLVYARKRLAQAEGRELSRLELSRAEQRLRDLIESATDPEADFASALDAGLELGVSRRVLDSAWQHRTALESQAWHAQRRQLAKLEPHEIVSSNIAQPPAPLELAPSSSESDDLGDTKRVHAAAPSQLAGINPPEIEVTKEDSPSTPVKSSPSEGTRRHSGFSPSSSTTKINTRRPSLTQPTLEAISPALAGWDTRPLTSSSPSHPAVASQSPPSASASLRVQGAVLRPGVAAASAEVQRRPSLARRESVTTEPATPCEQRLGLPPHPGSLTVPTSSCPSPAPSASASETAPNRSYLSGNGSSTERSLDGTAPTSSRTTVPTPREELPSYGLDAELKAKAAAKYDPNVEHEAAQWVEAITNVRVVDDVWGSLRSGQVLCQLVNQIKPGTIAKINFAGAPFKERENISNFLRACRALGVQEYALFSTDDLYDGHNMMSVARCIHALGGALRRSVPEFQGPHLGVADTSKAKRDQKRDLRPASQTGGFHGAMERSHIDLTSGQIVRGGC